MTDQFFITLPSNVHEDSSASNFHVNLPQRIKLDGEWEVGLAEIIYPNSWYHVKQNNYIKFELTGRFVAKIGLVPGYYTNIQEFLEMLNRILRDSLLSEVKNVQFSLEKNSGKISFIITDSNINQIELTPDIAELMGFNSIVIYEFYNMDELIGGATITAENKAVNFEFYIEAIYVYCDIVEKQMVGNVMAPLLRIVEVQGHHMDIICKTYDSPHFVPILIKDISSIEINIKNDINQLIDFRYGKVIIKLQFRRKVSSFM
jgi:hypothetical protein